MNEETQNDRDIRYYNTGYKTACLDSIAKRLDNARMSDDPEDVRTNLEGVRQIIAQLFRFQNR